MIQWIHPGNDIRPLLPHARLRRSLMHSDSRAAQRCFRPACRSSTRSLGYRDAWARSPAWSAGPHPHVGLTQDHARSKVQA